MAASVIYGVHAASVMATVTERSLMRRVPGTVGARCMFCRAVLSRYNDGQACSPCSTVRNELGTISLERDIDRAVDVLERSGIDITVRGAVLLMLVWRYGLPFSRLALVRVVSDAWIDREFAELSRRGLIGVDRLAEPRLDRTWYRLLLPGMVMAETLEGAGL